MKRVQVLAAGILAVFIWSSIPVLVKLTLTSIGVAQYLLLRFGIGLLATTPWLAGVWRKRGAMPAWWWGLLALDLLANYYFQSLAMQGLPASWYIVIFSLNPILALLLLRVRLNRPATIALLCAFAGTLVFVRSGESVRFQDGLFIAIGMLTWVFYTVMIAKLQSKLSDREITGVTQLLSFVAVLGLWLALGAPWSAVDTTGQVAIAILGLSSPLAYFLFSVALRELPIFGVASQYLEPVFGMILAFLVFQERQTPWQLVGAAVIILAMIYLSRTSKK